MSVLIALILLMLCADKVHCAQEGPACPQKQVLPSVSLHLRSLIPVLLAVLIIAGSVFRIVFKNADKSIKKSYPGVLALKVGSEVILGCRGDVTVDSMPLVMSTKQKEGFERRGDVTRHWKAQKARKRHDPEIENFATLGKLQFKTATGIYTKVNESVSTAKPAISSTKEQIGSGEDLQAVNQSIKSSGLSRDRPERGAFSITMEMELSTERSTDKEFEDYEKKVEGPRVTRSIKRQARWTRNGQLMRDGVEYGRFLRLPALQLTDSGNYSCFRRGKLVSSVKISVGIPPESPSLSCYKKSHISEIRCEWISRQPIIPQPQCYMLLRKGLENSHVNCSYSAACSCCWCVLSSRQDDRNVYTAKLCVTNTVGSATSSLYHYIPQNIIKPDPPDEVQVESVKGEPCMLNVSWAFPATWMWELFYTLHFQLRYRPQHSKKYQQVDTESRDWLILDALPHIEYEIQIRAKDEYEGQWSDWTSPVYAQTWTAPETTVAPDINTSLEPIWIFPKGSERPEGKVDDRPSDDSDGEKWVHVLWAVGVCLIITIIIFLVYCFRHRIPLMSKRKKESVSLACSCSSPSPLLQHPLMIQGSSHQEGEGEGIHLHNIDYFFSPCGPARS